MQICEISTLKHVMHEQCCFQTQTSLILDPSYGKQQARAHSLIEIVLC